MRISQTDIVPFAIPLIQPLIVITGHTKTALTHRRGVSLRIKADSHEGIGELVEPVFTSGERSDTVFTESVALLSLSLPPLRERYFDVSNWRRCLIETLNCVVVSRSEHAMASKLARFCIEQCLLTLISNTLSIPLHGIIHEWVFASVGALCPIRVRLNTMFNARLGDAGISNCGVVKLKVGGGIRSLVEEAAMVNHTASLLSDRTQLRLDANQTWTMEEAGYFGTLLAPTTLRILEYIEEPMHAKSADELRLSLMRLRSEFACWKNIKIALDESLLLPGVESLLAADASLAIVHKSFLHGLSDSILLLRFPNRVTFSCTFETGIGLRFLTAMAAAVNPSQYHGLVPLKDMADSDPASKKFQEDMKEDEEGLYIVSS